MFAHISTSSILLCAKMDNINGFVVDCSRYMSCFHIINQSRNVLQISQSEEVLSSSHFFAIDIFNLLISTHYTDAADWSVLTPCLPINPHRNPTDHPPLMLQFIFDTYLYTIHMITIQFRAVSRFIFQLLC